MQRTVFITGAKRGIGQQIKGYLLEKGFKVISPDRSELDLSSRSSLETYLSGCNEKIDILINNAGENTLRKIEEIDYETWDRMMQINVTSPMRLTQFFAPKMAAQNFGRIVNISSVYSPKSRTSRCIYSCTKSALDALTRSSAVEFSKNNVLVNSICPGFVETELTRKNNTEETGRFPKCFRAHRP